MIQVDGFSPLQQAIADLVWQLPTYEDIVKWYDACDDDIKPVVRTVLAMLQYAYIDSAIDDGIDLAEANEIINHIKEL